jgi:hypothetical protein
MRDRSSRYGRCKKCGTGHRWDGMCPRCDPGVYLSNVRPDRLADGIRAARVPLYAARAAALLPLFPLRATDGLDH